MKASIQEYSSLGAGLPPLAIIGMSLRFPQEAVTAEAFWDMLISKRCASSDVPQDRFNVAAFHYPDSTRLDSMSARGGHFIKGDLGAFDAPFFSIGAAEAAAMDPTQRFILETAYRAIENAGISVDRIAGTNTCVYTGSFTNDYGTLLLKDPATPSKYHGVGNSMSMQANRVSWFFDLTGPSSNLDAACSSSLIALDSVCQSIWNGNSTMGLACGSNLLLVPESMISMDNLGFLSKDSRCFSFDHRANGYARGEGFGVLVIKPLQDALKDGDTIRAVIRSSYSNRDGRTPTLTQPSKTAQERLIRDTYRKAGLDMDSTRYVETHGTGTPVGDPIEAGAIGAAFRRHRSPKEPLYLGSVKSNIGHLGGASGVAGVIKVILALERGVILPNTNFERLNPKIDAEFLNIKVPTEALPWPSKGLRRASVQSFGFGGSNCHVVLDDAYNFLLLHGLKGNHNTVPEPPSREALLPPLEGPTGGNGLKEHRHVDGTNAAIRRNGISSVLTSESDSQVLVWSSADEDGISRLVESWREHFTSLPVSNEAENTYLRDLAHTLTSRRTHFPWRTFAVARGHSDVHDLADEMAAPIKAAESPQLAFIFTGQGAQWYAMGRELLGRFTVFRNSMVEAGVYLKGLGCSWDPVDELLRDEVETKVNNTQFGQPLCTALQVALVDLLESFGVRPTAVVGHSSGEVAAAYAAKALNRESAWKVAYYRGMLAAQLGEAGTMKGGMLSVGLSRDDLLSYLDNVSAHFGDVRLVVACVNSPTNLTISGDALHLDHLKALLDKDEIFARKLKAAVAYHSFQMGEIAEQYLSCIGNLTGQESQTNAPLMVSSVTGSWVSPETVSKPEYWVNNMVQPVMYSDALLTLCSQTSASKAKKLDGSHRHRVSVNQLIEIGPHAALQGPSREILRSIGREKEIPYMSVLKRKAHAVYSVLEAAGRLHCIGYPINLTRVNSDTSNLLPASPPKTLTSLPEYPFNHSKKYWHESRLSKGSRFRPFGRVDLLGTPSQDWNPLKAKWRNIIRVQELPWVADLEINGAVLYPAAGMIVMAIEAAKQLADTSREIEGFVVKNAAFRLALNVPPGPEGIEVNIYLRPRKDTDEKDSEWFDFRLCTFDGDSWFENCNASIQVVNATAHSEMDRGQEAQLWKENHRRRHQDFLRKCTTTVDAQSFYEHIARCGYGYGPAFRTITSVAYDGVDSIVSDIKTFRWSGHEDPSIAQRHIIHPTTLDGILHSIFAVHTKGGIEMMPTTIPTHIDWLWLTSKALSHPDADSVRVYASTNWKGLRETDSTINVLDAAAREVLLEVKGLKTSVVAAADSTEDAEQTVRDRCHYVEWKPDLELLSVDGVQAFCNAEVPRDAEPVEFYTEFDFLIMAFINRTLKAIKEDLASGPESKYHTKMYCDWMKHQMRLLGDGASPFSSPEWRVRLEDDEYIAQLREKFASANPLGALYTTIGANLHNLLTGEMDILSLLFQGDLAKDNYEMWNLFPCMKGLAGYLDAYAHKNPGAKILKIGAGTGGMTQILMKVLAMPGVSGRVVPRYGHFDYTDISPFFFDAARDSYRDHGKRMRFKTLDIERDPELQGYECGSYDVVLAGQVLHATANLTATLEHCRKLLKPGGKLVLFETTRPDAIRTAFAFGLLEGWWLGSEQYRKRSPCIDEDKWDELLKQTGFSGNEIVLHDYNDNVCHESSVIISTAVGPSQTATTTSNADAIIIHGTQQKQLAQDVQTYFQTHGNFVVRLATVEQALEKVDFHSETVVVFLLELYQPVWSSITSDLFSKLRKLLTSIFKVLWVGQGGGLDAPAPEFRVVDGLFRVLNSELGGAVLASLSLETHGSLSSQQMGHVMKLSQELLKSPDLDTDYVEHNGLLHINRLVQADNLNTVLHERQLLQKRRRELFGRGVPLRLTVGFPGHLETLHFVEDKERDLPLPPDELEVQVQSVGLNFRDVLIALGQLSYPTIGCECAGIVTRVGENCQGFSVGTRVAACFLDSYKSFVRLDYRSVVKIPDAISFSVAAAITTNYVTAWHSFHEIARVQPGEMVLVHSGAGGTGQAAIQMAQHLGATVFATVGTEEKRQWLMQRYNIPPEHIFSSRDTTFGQSIKRLTSGCGVDVVLNSLTGERLATSWECVAPYGRFIEIGKKEILSHQHLRMSHFERNVTFSAVDIAAMSVERPSLVRKALEAIFPLIEKGALTPSEPMQIYGVSELEKAFRNMQSGRSHGKIVVDLKADDYVETVLDTKPGYYFDSNATYVIAGGLGGLGRRVSRWFVQRGDRNLILLSRSGGGSSHAQALISELSSQGAYVKTPACNIIDSNTLKATLRECLEDMPPVKGCIQLSTVLRDATFEAMTFESWQAATLPKVQGSWNLHALLPRDMDFFVMFSSLTGIIGSRGQSNYTAGNTFQDALARYRVGIGETASSLDLGSFLTSGILSEDEGLRERSMLASLLNPMTEPELFALLDYYFNPREQHHTPLHCQPVVGVDMAPEMRERGRDLAYWLKKASFRQVVAGETNDEAFVAARADRAGRVSFQGLFAACSSLSEAAGVVTEALVKKLARTLSRAQEELDASKPMHSYGIDSLVAVELRSWFLKEPRADMAIFDILGGATIATVGALAAAKSSYRKREWVD